MPLRFSVRLELAAKVVAVCVWPAAQFVFIVRIRIKRRRKPLAKSGIVVVKDQGSGKLRKHNNQFLTCWNLWRLAVIPTVPPLALVASFDSFGHGFAPQVSGLNASTRRRSPAAPAGRLSRSRLCRLKLAAEVAGRGDREEKVGYVGFILVVAPQRDADRRVAVAAALAALIDRTLAPPPALIASFGSL